MSEAGLRDVNRIPPKMLVRAGSTLLVPRPEHRAQDVSEALADNATMALAPDVPPMRRVVLRAGKRDTVASVARRYRVAPSMVAQWNRTGLQSSFTKGQQIVVFVPRAPTRSLASGSGRNSGRKVAAVAPRVQSSAKAGPRAKAAQRNRIRVASAR
jgi:membrane-bound lytic murein transglycosylase D